MFGCVQRSIEKLILLRFIRTLLGDLGMWAQGKFTRIKGYVLATSLLLAPIVHAANEDDPWEPMNRAIFGFNETLDRYTLKPIAEGYQKVLPDPVQRSVKNVFNNMGDVRNLVNSLLQGKVYNAGVDTSRLLFNTTFGVFGLFDVATPMGLQRNDEDFGQTLAAWGIGSGPYLVLPLLGPSTVRDGLALVPDSYTVPYRYIDDVPARNSTFALDIVQRRVSLLPLEKMITGDRYVFVRNAYLQNREFRINDGQVDDDF